MCGRFLVKVDGRQLARLFDLEAPPTDEPRFDISPGQSVITVRRGAGRRNRATAAKWGFILERDGARKTVINARSETAPERPTFRTELVTSRVIVPASGWYEWLASGGKRGVPHRVEPTDGVPLAFAGLWRRPQRRPGDFVESEAEPGEVVIMTTAASPALAWLHDRMPAIVPPENVDAWLEPRVRAPAAALALLAPPGELDAQVWRVSGPLGLGPTADDEAIPVSVPPLDERQIAGPPDNDLTARKRAR